MVTDHHDGDEALRRLRASDPATGSHPDLTSLRHAVDTRAPGSSGVDGVTRLRDDLGRGGRGRPAWIAAAAVAAIAMGVGGYALGSQNAAPPVAGSTATTGTGGQEPAPAAGEHDEVRATEDDVLVAEQAEAAIATDKLGGGGMGGSGLYDPGPVRLLPGAGLPTGPGTGEVRALTTDVNPAEAKQQWAQALGFEDPVELQGGTFLGEDALLEPSSLRTLSAYRDHRGLFVFGYENYSASPYCTDMWSDASGMQADWEQAVPGVPYPGVEHCQELGGVPSEQEAISAVEDLLRAGGIDPASYEFSIVDSGDPEAEIVMVDGWPVGEQGGDRMISAQVGGAGVSSAWGATGQFTSLGDYPLITASEAVVRHAQREFGMDYVVSLPTTFEEGAAEMSVAGPDLPVGAPLEPGSAIPLLRQDKTVVSAELVRGTLYTQSGALEVPTWQLWTEDGMNYLVLAVADSAIEWQGWR